MRLRADMAESKKWSVYFQNPEFLERTRLFMIHPDMFPLVRRWCGIKDGVRLLDVGCGTGYFTRLLSSGGEMVTASGIDLEEPFIEYAKKEAAEQGLPIEFIVGDALSLPFEDNTFDAVVSHTFFTSIPDPERAMAEMIRVIKPGGIISSVTPMSFAPECTTGGEWGAEKDWIKEFNILFARIYGAYFVIDSLRSRLGGLKPKAVPGFFSKHGLKNVSAYSIGKIFALSSRAVSDEDKLRYIRLYQESEDKKLKVYEELPEMRKKVTEEDRKRFRELLDRKCEWLKEHIHDNDTWEWQGGANLLVTGVCEKKGEKL